MQRPNILYLHTHDTGRYVQPYGYAIPTPNLQRLAEQGVLFRQAFCSGPTCSPSRAAMLTGQCAHSSGMCGLAHRGFALHDYRQHIIHTLRAAGYESTLIGVQHIATDRSVIGYDRIVKVGGNKAETVGPAAAQLLADSPRQPFFLSVGCGDTHRTFSKPSEGVDERYCRPPEVIPDTPETRRDMAGFITDAMAIDRGFGVVLDGLAAAGLDENTLVICTTDHGASFPDVKCNLTDHGIGVMLMMRGPGGFEGGKVIDAMVSQVDVFPTICELASIDPPPWLQGQSILPLIHGETDAIHEEILAEVTYHAAYEPMRCVRTTRYKYIRRFSGRRRPVLANCDDGPSKDLWLSAGWADRPVADEELYDLIFDPCERLNRAGDPDMADVLADLRRRLDEWMHRTDDPLLAGPVPIDPAATLSDPDDVSPKDAGRRRGVIP